MKKYPIKIAKKDFRILETSYNIKGSRVKKVVIDKFGKKAFFKYEHKDYITSEACSEKMCYEIASVLGYDCARIELAKDSLGNLGILNYFFVDGINIEHMDAVSYLNMHDEERNKYYTISNIKKILDELDTSLFYDFIRILVFDALVGEQDRHEENWGIQKVDYRYKISPLYDNGCNLLRDFKNLSFAQKFYSGMKDFDAYIEKSKTLIYKENHKDKYRHFELVEYLNGIYHEEVQEIINNLNKLTDKKIEGVVNRIPDDLLTKIHKEYIISYLKKRKERLLSIK